MVNVPDGYREVDESEVPLDVVFYLEIPGQFGAGKTGDGRILHRDDDGRDRYFVKK